VAVVHHAVAADVLKRQACQAHDSQRPLLTVKGPAILQPAAILLWHPITSTTRA
jgi:hypothetical protein